MSLRFYKILIVLFFVHNSCTAQSIDSLPDNINKIPNNFLAKIQKKYTSVTASLTRKTNKYLQKMQRQEKMLQRKAAKSDSGIISTENVDSIYAAFRNRQSTVANSLSVAGKVHLRQYNPFIDTLSTSLAFLQKYKNFGENIKLPTQTLNNLKNELNETEKVKEFIAQRKEFIKEQLSKYTHLPAALKSQYANIQKTAYYYSAQVKEYKDMINDPKKIEERTITLLNQMPFFQKFMQHNSLLASLFRLPGSSSGQSGNPATTLAGLQTRFSVLSMIQQRIAAGGPNASTQVHQNLQDAQSKLSQLKDKLLKNPLAGGRDGSDIPDFKPNTQKTKPLLKRLEFGFNAQFSKNSSLLPSSTDLALTIGYKMNDKCVIGIGSSYKLGLGNIQHISFTSLGLGLRSYLDWKATFLPSFEGAGGGLYITGGYEMNYNSAFKSFEQLKNYDLWQRSALLGISKKYKISKKLKGTMQLLYDLLYRSHVPESQPVIFRMGYNF